MRDRPLRRLHQKFDAPTALRAGLLADTLRGGTHPREGRPRTSGTRIPIVSEEAWRQDSAAVCLFGSWQFAKFFMEREHDYLSDGGRFMIPLPQVELVEQKAEAV